MDGPISPTNNLGPGSKDLPKCTRCKQSGVTCVYPTSRKRVSLETKFSSLRRKLQTTHRNDQLDSLLDGIEPDVLRAALERKSRDAFSTPWTADVKEPFSPSQTREASEPGSSTPPEVWWQDNVTQQLGNQHSMLQFFDATTTDPSAGSTHLKPTVSTDGRDDKSYALPFPAALIDELFVLCLFWIELFLTVLNSVELYFRRVQPSFPLLHRPRFCSKFQTGSVDTQRFLDLALEDALILTSVMALSARFYSGDFFGSTPYKERGGVFAQQAMALYAEGLQSGIVNDGSLLFLQGCILLAFYMLAQEVDTRAWLLVGTCCRIGIDLRLDQVDRDLSEAAGITAIEWSHREEKRRAWWLMWELDIFVSTMLRRRRGIGKDQMRLLLPVSDSAWFSDTPDRSLCLLTEPHDIWRTLENYPSAPERVWFIVTEALMATAADLGSPGSEATLQDIVSFQSTLDCFALLLPEDFHVDFNRSPFTEDSFASKNWTFSTILMLHSVRILTRNAQYTKAPDRLESLPTGPYSSTDLVFRTLQDWAPEYLVYTCPFVSCTIIGPAFENVRAALLFEPGNRGTYFALLTLVLKRIGTLWPLGQATSKLIDAFESELRINGTYREAFKKFSKDFSVLVTDPTRMAEPLAES